MVVVSFFKNFLCDCCIRVKCLSDWYIPWYQNYWLLHQNISIFLRQSIDFTVKALLPPQIPAWFIDFYTYPLSSNYSGIIARSLSSSCRLINLVMSYFKEFITFSNLNFSCCCALQSSFTYVQYVTRFAKYEFSNVSTYAHDVKL